MSRSKESQTSATQNQFDSRFAQKEDWWPEGLEHWGGPVHADNRGHLTVAEVCYYLVNGKHATRLAYTGLIPRSYLRKELSWIGDRTGGQQWSSGPAEAVEDEGSYQPKFWISSTADQSRRYEPLSKAWNDSTDFVVAIDHGFCMTYGLVPRLQSGNGSVSWDNRRQPDLDVVIEKNLAHYHFQKESHAYVKVQKRYLADYLWKRGRAAVLFYYEQLWVPRTKDFSELLGTKQQIVIDLPGREIIVKSLPGQDLLFLQISGRKLLLQSARMIAWPDELPALEWPGQSAPITHANACSRLGLDNDYVYVRDIVLRSYEGDLHFQINPLDGSVNRENIWSLSCSRIGRDILKIDLKNLYEAIPPEVVLEWHKHAVMPPSKSTSMIIRSDIGYLAEGCIKAFVKLGNSLSFLSEKTRNEKGSKEFISIDLIELEEIWWNDDFLLRLGYVAPVDMKNQEFLARCKLLFSLLEKLQEAALRGLVLALGAPDKDIAELRALKLLHALVCILQKYGQTGLSWPEGKAEVITLWKPAERNPDFQTLFALADLRVIEAHALTSQKKKFEASLKTLGIDQNVTVSGWGSSLDGVYVAVTEALSKIADDIRRIADSF